MNTVERTFYIVRVTIQDEIWKGGIRQENCSCFVEYSLWPNDQRSARGIQPLFKTKVITGFRFRDRVLGDSFREWEERKGGIHPCQSCPVKITWHGGQLPLQAETDLPLNRPVDNFMHTPSLLQARSQLILISTTKYDAVRPSAQYNDIKEKHICPSTVRTVFQDQSDEEKTGIVKILQYSLAM